MLKNIFQSQMEAMNALGIPSMVNYLISSFHSNNAFKCVLNSLFMHLGTRIEKLTKYDGPWKADSLRKGSVV